MCQPVDGDLLLYSVVSDALTDIHRRTWISTCTWKTEHLNEITTSLTHFLCQSVYLCVCVCVSEPRKAEQSSITVLRELFQYWKYDNLSGPKCCACVFIELKQQKDIVRSSWSCWLYVRVRWGSLGTFCVMRFNIFHYQVFIKENESGSVLHMSLNPPNPGFMSGLYIFNLIASVLYFYSHLFSFSVIYT